MTASERLYNEISLWWSQNIGLRLLSEVARSLNIVTWYNYRRTLEIHLKKGNRSKKAFS